MFIKYNSKCKSNIYHFSALKWSSILIQLFPFENLIYSFHFQFFFQKIVPEIISVANIVQTSHKKIFLGISGIQKARSSEYLAFFVLKNASSYKKIPLIKKKTMDLSYMKLFHILRFTFQKHTR